MLPYGMIYYYGAPADLRDIPLGTVLYGQFFLLLIRNFICSQFQWERSCTPCRKPCSSSEDDISFCLREGKSWKLSEVDLTRESKKYSTSANERDGHLVATLKPHKDGAGLEGEHRLRLIIRHESGGAKNSWALMI